MATIQASSFPKHVVDLGAMAFLPKNLSGFIATRAFDALPGTANKSQGSIIAFDRHQAQRLQDHGARGDGGVAVQLRNSFSTVNFSTEDRAFRYLVTNKERVNASGIYNADDVAMRLTMSMVLRALEDAWASAFFKTTVWTDQTAPTTKWGAAGSDPIGDVGTARDTLEAKLDVSLEGNGVGICGYKVANTLQRHAAFKDFAGVRVNTGNAPLSKIAEAFSLREILVSKAIRVTSREGAATVTQSDIVGDGFLVLAGGDVLSLDTPAAGATVVFSPLRPRTYRTEDLAVGANWVESSMDLDMIKMDKDLGVFIDDTL